MSDLFSARRSGSSVFVKSLVCGFAFLLTLGVSSARAQTSPRHSKAASSATQAGQSASTPLTVHPRPFHIVPFGPPSKRRAAVHASGEPVLPYWGGPVISNIHVVEILWGKFVDSGSTTGLEQYFTDVTNSAYFDLLSEYGTVGVTGQGGAPGSNQLIGRGVFDGKYQITPSLCPGSASHPPPTCSLTDGQIQTELVNQLPNLPAPVTDTQGNFNSMYLIYFPPGVNISLGNFHSCVGGGFCAYHSSLPQLSDLGLPYGVFPDFSPASGCSQGCGQSSPFNDLTSASSHEIGEAVTDVDVGSATAYAPPLAWDSDQTGEEIGDLCNQDQTQITVGTKTYTVQKMWSNMQNACVAASAQYELAGPAAAVPGEPFNLTVTAAGPGSNFALPLYDHTVHFTSADAQAVLPPDYKFIPATDAGAHTFSFTLNTLGNQSITATDTVDPVITASATVAVNHNPDLTAALAHAGNFTQGQTAATYTLTVSNGGDRPTTGAVSVIDTLPSDLTPTAITGSGWACTLATTTCTRSDALAAAGRYPAITITVNVSATAPPTVTNSAIVSGGGEANSINDAVYDATTISQVGDLTVASTHSGSFSQGQTGASYTITVSNIGQASTSGKVTVVDSLPAGLTATAISGAGWSCTFGTLTCTRTDAQAASGSYSPITLTVNVALNALTSVTNVATVSGGGEVNTGNDVSSDVTVVTGPAPDLVISSTHTGNFTQGQAGATYSLVVSNSGPAATSGTVTVSDYLPPDLAATDMTGTGWSCVVANLTCTRGDALAAGPGTSYPPILVTVNVSPVAPSSVTNEAAVSGGGELDGTNDSANDSTTILPWPDMVMVMSHQGTLSQGQTGATYTLTAVNNGAAPTFGTVFVTDTLPAGLTATDMSGPGWNCALSTLTCTRADSLLIYPDITLTVNVAIDAPSSITNTATAFGGGEIYTADNTATDQATVLPPVSISVLGSNGTVNAGGTANYSFSLISTAAGSVNLTCGGLPAKTSCTFQPASVIGSQVVNLSIATTKSTLSSALPRGDGHNFLFYASLLPFSLAGILWITRRQGKHGKKLQLVTSLAAFAGLLLLAACGGASMTPPPPPPPNGTPPGTYTITITANDATDQLQGTTTVTLTVNP